MDVAGNTYQKEITNENAIKHFVLTVVGFAVGAFLLPYILIVIFYGIPLIILEIMIGTHFQKHHYNTWQFITPVLGGIGVASCIIAFFLLGCLGAIMMLLLVIVLARSILSLQVWLDAISQLCYTYGITFGPLISIGRICKCSRTNTYLTSIMIGLWTLGTSVLVSVVVYSNLGNIAWSNHQYCISRRDADCLQLEDTI
ncbi:hypothetical protein KUTeg_007715, partial [Tegillarca granosa]